MKAKPQEVSVNLEDYITLFLPPAERRDEVEIYVRWIEQELNIKIMIDSEDLSPLPKGIKEFLLKLQGPHGKTIMAAYKAKYGYFQNQTIP